MAEPSNTAAARRRGRSVQNVGEVQVPDDPFEETSDAGDEGPPQGRDRPLLSVCGVRTAGDGRAQPFFFPYTYEILLEVIFRF